MFNKREPGSPETLENDTPTRRKPDLPPASPGGPAVIGASIQVDGALKGDEDLLIEGRVKGNVELKKNSVTIGPRGQVQADIYAHTIYVEGNMEGNLVAAERIVVRKSAQIKGTITAPRVSLEDGARFNGSIDMDPETETLKKAFGQRSDKPSSPPVSVASSNRPDKPAESNQKSA